MLPINFIRESNRIEGIHRDPTEEELEEYSRFMRLDKITVEDLEKFVSVYQPNARLRDQYGLNVRIGPYYPPKGCPEIRENLKTILANIEHGGAEAYQTHIVYENLHPFTDGNGRSGRMLWLWQMRHAPLGFLHTFYYQTLDAS